MSIRNTLLALLLALAAALPAEAQSAATPGVTAVRCGRLVDVKTGTVVQNAVVLVSGGRIVEVGPDVAIPPNARVIDLSQATVLPGLVDAHTHLLQNYDP